MCRHQRIHAEYSTFERLSFQPHASRIPFSNSVEGLGKMRSVQILALPTWRVRAAQLPVPNSHVNYGLSPISSNLFVLFAVARCHLPWTPRFGLFVQTSAPDTPL